jgi:UDP-glucose 4-epimerase
MSVTNKHILITGGLGYVGGRLATHLAIATPEHTLRLTTRRNGDRVPAWAKDLDVVQADVLDQESLDSALSGIDTVIHLAAANEIESARDPDLALDVNGKGTHRLLEACKNHDVTRLIYFSTFHVYGPTAPQLITEETPTRPIHPYAITHRLAEDFINWYNFRDGLSTAIVRLSNGYGYPADPGVDRWSLVFNDLCLQAVKDGKLTLRTKGGQTRDFVSLSDVGHGVQHLMDLPADRLGDGLFNLGGDCTLSILDVAERIASEFSNCYGREVPVILGEAEDQNIGAPVQFSVEKLKATGFSLVGDMSREIQKSFSLCEQLVNG